MRKCLAGVVSRLRSSIPYIFVGHQMDRIYVYITGYTFSRDSKSKEFVVYIINVTQVRVNRSIKRPSPLTRPSATV